MSLAWAIRSPTHLMSKYLALLALPPLLKKLRAIWKLPAAMGGDVDEVRE